MGFPGCQCRSAREALATFHAISVLVIWWEWVLLVWRDLLGQVRPIKTRCNVLQGLHHSQVLAAEASRCEVFGALWRAR